MPDEVRQAHRDDLETREPRPPRAGDKFRPPIRKRAAGASGDEADEEYDQEVVRDKKRAVELITDLLRLDEGRKKPISQYTDEDFQREERELSLKIKREELRSVRIRNELFERLHATADKLDNFLTKGAQALDLYIADKEPAQPNIAVVFGHEGHQQSGYDPNDTSASDAVLENRDSEIIN